MIHMTANRLLPHHVRAARWDQAAGVDVGLLP